MSSISLNAFSQQLFNAISKRQWGVVLVQMASCNDFNLSASPIKKIAANRKNTLKSTGPKTAEGKELTRRNSIKHGLLSKDLIIDEEDSRALQTLMDDLFTTLQPVGKIEEVLTEKIGSTLWRMQRLISAESKALEEKDWMGELRKLQEAYNSSILSSITRYESNFERPLYRALHELQRIQGMRQGEAVLTPIAVDVHSNI